MHVVRFSRHLIHRRALGVIALIALGACGTERAPLGPETRTPSTARSAADEAAEAVRVNEVESNQGTPGDWVELHNRSASAIDLSGYVFRDNDDSRGYVLPTGTTIPANGFLVLDEAQFTFGLGANDTARLFAPDGTTLIDSYAWTAHAPTTWARCPDGSGAFQAATRVTKGTTNDCAPQIVINEIESSGGVPGDWVELLNNGPAPVDVGGWVFRDNNDAAGYVIPANTVIQAGGYLVLDEAQFGFGLGAADAARLYLAGGTTLVDSHTWTAHAATTLGRCPNGTGTFTVTGSATKGALNDCGALTTTVKINEVESNLGTPGDWVELFNTGATPVDLSGYIFRDNNDAAGYVLPAGSVIGANSYLVLEEVQFGFGLGGGDAARLFGPGGSALIDSYVWTAHASTTYGRCPNGTGDFTTTSESTKGAANACAALPSFDVWPGGATVENAEVGGLVSSNLSGLVFEGSRAVRTQAPGVVWAVRNGPGALFRLRTVGGLLASEQADGWSAGKLLRYPDGSGDVDAEGVTVADGAIFVAAERNNANNGVSRNSILRYDVRGTAAELVATREWDLTADLPANGANLGLEAITFVPDSFLVARGFVDDRTGRPYAPSVYAGHGTGLFLVGVEATGDVHAYALSQAGPATRVATFSSGFPQVMDLTFDGELGQLWAACDNGCNGRLTVLTIEQSAGASRGRFVVQRRFERPAGMPNLNNEGFALAPLSECVAGSRQVFWADDGNTGNISLRRGTLQCAPF